MDRGNFSRLFFVSFRFVSLFCRAGMVSLSLSLCLGRPSCPRQAQDIFDSPAEAEEHTPGWSKAVVVGQVCRVYAVQFGAYVSHECAAPPFAWSRRGYDSDFLSMVVRRVLD